ncbi:hypothetical protein PIB30_009636 [Stylosanthes scabra]|uniref:Ubiquitin-like protease family profile domain-containing protein n=1 Tax=Stylosanthes scabra TaxID=79078 RepID=A0ABU6T684_9FABA|nr:hypothetical protein [Stylosanthes scabra]
MSQGLARQAKNRTPTRKQSKAPPKIKLPQTKKQITETNLVKSLQIEGPKAKKILGKRKQMEEEEETDSSEYESESAFEPELESESDSDPDSERTISEDEAMPADEPVPEVENVGVVERRSKRRHENMNANVVPPPHQPVVEEDNAANEDVVQQPHQNAEEDNNAAGATDAVVGPSSQLTANLSDDITPLGDSESQDKDVNPAPVATATSDIAPESDGRDTASVVGAAIEVEGVEEGTQTDNTLEHTQDGDSEIFYASFEDPPTSVEEETTLTNLVQNITTQQHNDVLEDIQHGDTAIVEKEIALTPLFQNITTQEHMPQEKQLEESVTGPKLTLKDLALKGTAEHDTTSEITIEKPLIAEEISKSDPKEDVAIVDKGEEDIMYEFLFKFITGKTFEAVREHFMSLAKEAKMDLAIMQIMCIFHNMKKNERFRDMIYYVSPKFMKYHHTYLNTETGRPYELSTMENDNDLEYIVKDKMKEAHYSNILDQMMVYAGAETMFLGPITPQVASHSLLPKYIHVPKQTNQFDCGVYVLKYLEMVNPTELGKKTYKIPPWSEDERAEFREQIVEYILLHHDNFYRTKAVEASEPRQRTSRPSRALQSPYMQLNSSDLESGKAKHKKK